MGSRTRAQGAKSKSALSNLVDKVTGFFGSGSTDAIEMLKADHDRVDALFQKAKANEDGDNTDVFKKIKAELDVHAHIEEKIFYPHLLEHGDKELKKIVREGLEEHRQVKMFLAELEKLSGKADQFKAKLQVLMEDVEHHVREEENDMFPMVKDQVDEEMLVRLASLMEAEKAKTEGKAIRSASARARTSSRSH